MDRASIAGDMSGRVGGSIRVRFDRGEHVKPLIVKCQVLKRLGRVGDTWRAVVEHEGKQLLVEHTLTRGVWRPCPR